MGKSEDKIKENKTKEITIDQINPYIRTASKHFIEGGLNTGERINIHYQLHYICEGKGVFIINNQRFDVVKGDFLFWAPGEVHSIFSNTEEPLQVIGVQFDFTRNYSHVEYPCIHMNTTSFSWHIVNEAVVINGMEEIPICSKVFEQELVKGYLKDLVKLFESNSTFSQHIMSGILKSIIVTVIEGNMNREYIYNKKGLAIKEVLSYINEHHQERLTNSFLGEKFGYHPNHLNLMFLKHTGYTIQQYLIHIRMNKAIDLLLHTNKTISEIGEAVGGYSIHYFSRLFKKKTGLNPSEFRR